MERIEKALKNLVDELEGKGYDTKAFQTNACYSETLEKSVKQYLYDSLLGLEDGLKEELRLATYLKFEGDDKESICGCMFVKYEPGIIGKFEIYGMNLVYRNAGIWIRNVELKNLTTATLPTCEEVIQKVENPRNIKSKRFKF
ncbi:hypothetical protein MUB18_20560 [Sphingobacterium sp. PCS056]|uniref:Uncharacterized protein n=1 Tax=Flavobacterium supellecticarium TaxID=2565924 RepID=A0A4S4A3I4_9FLAO|nr:MULTISPECIES: hypothetical protein [Bacteroidota]THF52972.1 hypothetical protein E6C50_01835 [Flavobacterium supellecticarium]UPZ36481.1 hypothetical protein MUB18_20560 [Sphingobacterium sp. PCS056]